MCRIISIILVLIATSVVFAQETIIHAQGRSGIDREHTEWVDNVMRSILTLKPGMARKDLLRVFTEEGGLSNRRQQTYVYRECPYIKVDVEFDAVGNEGDGLIKAPEDKIVKISRPYLQYAIVD